MTSEKALRKGINRLSSDMREGKSLSELNEDIFLLNQEILQMKEEPGFEIVSDIELLREQILDYEAKFPGDSALEMIANFQKSSS